MLVLLVPIGATGWSRGEFRGVIPSDVWDCWAEQDRITHGKRKGEKNNKVANQL